MANADTLLKMIKKTAMDAVNASKPSDVVFGKVISDSPLKIQIDQKLILTSAMLVLTRNVKDFKVKMTVDHRTETASNHSHQYKGKKEFLVHNALIKGDEVLMIRQSGGQKYIVIDRI